MIRRIEWSDEAIEDLADLPDWRLAADVDATVKLFALVGTGLLVRWPSLAGADEYRLHVPPDHRYYARIRYSASVVYVERMLRSA